MLRSTGPVARESPPFLIAFETVSGEKGGTKLSNGQSLRRFSLTIRLDGALVWETAAVNRLAKAVAISRLRVRALEERVMVDWEGFQNVPH